MSVEEGKLLPVKHLAYFTKTRQTPRSRQRETSLDQESEPLGPALSPPEPGLLCKVGTLVITGNWIWCHFDSNHFHFKKLSSSRVPLAQGQDDNVTLFWHLTSILS